MKVKSNKPEHEIKMLSVAIAQVHPLNLKTPPMDEHTFDALVHSINTRGFDSNISVLTVFRGLIVDGRHRLKAARQLGIEYLPCIELPHKTTKEALESFIWGTETKKSNSTIKKAYLALRALDENENMTQSEASLEFGVGTNTIKEMKTIRNLISPVMYETFYREDKLVFNGQTCKSIGTLLKRIKLATKLEQGEHELLKAQAVIDTNIKKVMLNKSEAVLKEIMADNTEADDATKFKLYTEAMERVTKKAIEDMNEAIKVLSENTQLKLGVE